MQYYGKWWRHTSRQNRQRGSGGGGRCDCEPPTKPVPATPETYFVVVGKSVEHTTNLYGWTWLGFSSPAKICVRRTLLCAHYCITCYCYNMYLIPIPSLCKNVCVCVYTIGCITRRTGYGENHSLRPSLQSSQINICVCRAVIQKVKSLKCLVFSEDEKKKRE